jgi:hypothetical protein
MTTQEEFETLYETSLKPKLVEFEDQRKGIVRKLKPIFIGYFFLMALLLLMLFMIETESFWPIIISIVGMIGLSIGIVYLYYQWVSPYTENFKKEVVGRIVTFIDENLIYEPEKEITLGEFRTSLLENFWHSVDKWEGEDYVEGMLGKTAVKFSEVHAAYRTTHVNKNGRTETRYHDIFKGLFFIFDFNKDFKGFTVVLPDYAERHLGRFGKMLQSWKAKVTLGELVELADPEFEREFVVYSDDQITARYVLSTSLMRRLLTFRHQLKKQIYLSFVDGKLYIGIPVSTDLFEPTVFETLLDFKLLYEFFEYLQLSKDIVEDLNLNTRIWSKK